MLTPNGYEFRRLCAAAGVEGEGEAALVALCAVLDGPTVLLKGAEDLVADASGHVLRCSVPGTPRRSGGLGDVLAGTLGTLLAWRPEQGLEAAASACELVRRSCRRAYERRHRAMTAPDALEELGDVFEELCPSG